MSVNLCDDGHHTAEHDESVYAYGHSAHAACFKDVNAVQTQLCACLHVSNVSSAGCLQSYLDLCFTCANLTVLVCSCTAMLHESMT